MYGGLLWSKYSVWVIGVGRGRKNIWNSEYSGFRLFGKIEWVLPLKTKKLLGEGCIFFVISIFTLKKKKLHL